MTPGCTGKPRRNEWNGKVDAKSSTFATLHIGHEVEQPNRVVLIGYTGKITEPSISWRCPDCKEIIKFKEGNICKCGHSRIAKIRGGLWVQFSVENSCLVPQTNLEEKP